MFVTLCYCIMSSQGELHVSSHGEKGKGPMHQRIRTTFGFSLQLPFVSGRESFVELRL